MAINNNKAQRALGSNGPQVARDDGTCLPTDIICGDGSSPPPADSGMFHVTPDGNYLVDAYNDTVVVVVLDTVVVQGTTNGGSLAGFWQADGWGRSLAAPAYC